MFSGGIVGEDDAGAHGDVGDGDDGDDDGDDHHDHRVLDVGLHQLLPRPHTLVITPTQEKQKVRSALKLYKVYHLNE